MVLFALAGVGTIFSADRLLWQEVVPFTPPAWNEGMVAVAWVVLAGIFVFFLDRLGTSDVRIVNERVELRTYFGRSFSFPLSQTRLERSEYRGFGNLVVATGRWSSEFGLSPNQVIALKRACGSALEKPYVNPLFPPGPTG